MPRRISALLITLVLAVPSLKGQVSSGEIQGKVINQKTGKPVAYANVVAVQDGSQVGGSTTDETGEYSIKPLDAGSYKIVATFTGFKKKSVTGVKVNSGDIAFVDVKMAPSGYQTETVEKVAYKEPLIQKTTGADDVTSAEEIKKLPSRGVQGIATTVGGVYQSPGGGALNVRGSRGSATDYYIDGVKVRGSTNLPQSAIQEVSVTTGGIPAQYGDATGGIISITTRGPRPEYNGSIEAVSSGFKSGDEVYGLDSYGYNLVEGNISGPIWKRADSSENSQPIMGFMLSANYTHQVDPRPTARPNWVVKDDVKDSLIQNPLRRGGPQQGAFQNAEFLTQDDFRKQSWRPNAASDQLSLSGKIDVNLAEMTNLTFGGNFNYSKRRGTPYNSSAFNYSNNPLAVDLDWRAFAKFSQRLRTEGDNKKGDASTLSNVYYQLQVDYSKETARREDAKHGDNLFNYGYIGKFKVQKTRSYDFRPNGYKVHDGFRDTLVTFEPSDKNRAMAATTEQYFNLYDDPDGRYENFDQVQQNNGLLNGDQPGSVYDIWTNVGTRSNSYNRQNNSQLRFTGRGSADIGDHALQIGFEYEQRVDRSFGIAPVGLWTRMRQLANFHIEELNRDDSLRSQDGQFTQVDYKRNVGSDQRYFDEQLRKSLGYDVRGRDYIQVDSISPDHYSLDMFSADELLNNGDNLVSYYGYDHTGEELDKDPSFEDFFRATQDGTGENGEGGVRSRPIGAYRPIYMAGYIMDEFTLDDIVFNVGLRVSRFDANQKVLKDKYLTKQAHTVEEKPDFGGGHPSTVGDDAVIYVDDASDPSTVKGYRSGEDWFNANGEPVNDPEVVAGPTGIQPYLVNPEKNTDGKKVSVDAFEDYEPQVNLLPRIAFSFNVRDDASFFAHYDVLAKRPRGGVARMDPLDYFYIENRDANMNNPKLKPEKTIDYEIGFQQKLSNRSALKISAFYREMRNMVQITRVVGAYPQGYKTYGNLDFGTVKGMTLKYDLRKATRSDNVRLKAYYTLQFSNGTGSDFRTQQNLINSDQPNLRTVTPLNFDQRHQFQITGDIRFPSKNYNGPTVNGVKVLKNTGLNIQSNFGSGTPYSALAFSLPEQSTSSPGTRAIDGGINGSRKPWQFRVDAQIDRDFRLNFGGEEDGKKKKTANLNVYLRINNLFNNLNVTNVYGYTGNPDDDGYLSASRWKRRIEQQRSEESYRDMYRMKMDDPFNYGRPRTIRLGARLDF